MRWPRSCAAALMVWSLQGPQAPDDARVAAGLADYRAARYQAALPVLRSELELRGDSCPPELRLDVALTELRLLRSRDAEEVLAPLVDDATFAADAAFLLGIASWQQAERAAAAARLPDAEPMAWMLAVRAIERCQLQFQRAAELRAPWPEAVRNAERAWRRQQQITAERDAARPPDAAREPAPQPPPAEPKPDGPPEAVLPEVAATQLSEQELAKLQQRVREQQQLKVRQRQQATRQGASVRGRDW